MDFNATLTYLALNAPTHSMCFISYLPSETYTSQCSQRRSNMNVSRLLIPELVMPLRHKYTVLWVFPLDGWCRLSCSCLLLTSFCSVVLQGVWLDRVPTSCVVEGGGSMTCSHIPGHGRRSCHHSELHYPCQLGKNSHMSNAHDHSGQRGTP